MTNEQAIKVLRDAVYGNDAPPSNNWLEALKIAERSIMGGRSANRLYRTREDLRSAD